MTWSPFVLHPKELLLCLPLLCFSVCFLSFFKVSPVWQGIQSERACTWHWGKQSQPAMESSSSSAVVPALLLAGAYTATPIIYSTES